MLSTICDRGGDMVTTSRATLLTKNCKLTVVQSPEYCSNTDKVSSVHNYYIFDCATFPIEVCIIQCLRDVMIVYSWNLIVCIQVFLDIKDKNRSHLTFHGQNFEPRVSDRKDRNRQST